MRSGSKSLLTALIAAVGFSVVGGVSEVQAESVSLTDAQLVQVAEGWCGYVENQWVPVQESKTAGSYDTVKSVVAKLKKKVNKASGAKKAKAKKKFKAARKSKNHQFLDEIGRALQPNQN